MKRILISGLTAVLVLAGCGTERSLENRLLKIQKKHGMVGMSVTLARDDSLVWSRGFGYRDVDRNLPVNRSTRYRIASISKLVTGMAVMQLYEQGLFRLHDDISGLVGFRVRNPQFPDQPVTVQALMSHTSGLRDCDAYFDFLYAGYSDSPPGHMRLLFTPGSDCYSPAVYDSVHGPAERYFQYGNINFGLLAALVERLSGERFDRYCSAHLFRPLELGCSFNVRDLEDIDDLAVLYRKPDSVWVPQTDHFAGVPPRPLKRDDYIPGTNGFLFSPQGGLRASSDELAVLGGVFTGRGMSRGVRILQDTTVIRMLTPVWVNQGPESGDDLGGVFENYALCNHMTTTLVPGRALSGHSGFAYGLVSDLFFSMEQGTVLAFLSNGGRWTEGGSGWYTVEEDVMRSGAAELAR